MRRRQAHTNKTARQQHQPYFLYLAFQNIHCPYTVHRDYIERYRSQAGLTEGERVMFGYVSELDDAVGEIVRLQRSPAFAPARYNNSVTARADRWGP